MQRQRKDIRKKRWTLLIMIALALVIAILGIQALTRIGQPVNATASRLPCLAGQQVTPFGEYVLYYDGVSIHCLTTTGTVRWSRQIGSDASFSAGTKELVAWVGSQMYIFDQNGQSTYNDNLGETVQFARVGKRYAAAVIGGDTNPKLVIKDLFGVAVDEESDAFSGRMLLDVGFYGDEGQYMWTLTLDVFGTVANTILNTFEVGQMNTGEIALGEALTYGVFYENSKLRVISTRQLRTFDYRGTEDATAAILVYGWKLIASEVPQKGDAMMLLAPTAQTNSQYNIRELRLLSGAIDRRLTLPATCVGATVHEKNMYAVSSDYIYRTDINAQRFSATNLPMGTPVTSFLGITAGGKLLVACGDTVYAVTIP